MQTVYIIGILHRYIHSYYSLPIIALEEYRMKVTAAETQNPSSSPLHPESQSDSTSHIQKRRKLDPIGTSTPDPTKRITDFFTRKNFLGHQVVSNVVPSPIFKHPAKIPSYNPSPIHSGLKIQQKMQFREASKGLLTLFIAVYFHF